jgi:hypothetical protein
MHTPATALAWEFWHRHRLGLSGVGALVAAFAAAAAVSPFSANLAGVNSLWFIMGLCYVIGVFAYGFDGKLETAESGFPARLLRLPVRTYMLVGWPMLQGVAVAVLLWLVWDHLVLRPSGIDTPRWWAAMLAAIVAVSQSLVWMPYGLPWVRLLVMITALTALIRAPAILALMGDGFADPAEQNGILSVLAVGLVAAAFLAAYVGVGRARRGDTPDWSLARREGHPSSPARRNRPFRSAIRAQVWYEWRACGRGFVLATACFLAMLAGVSAATGQYVENQMNIVSTFFLIPIMLAATGGTYAGTATSSNGGLSAYAATRPLSNVEFVRAKYVAAALATVAAWIVVLAVLALWLSYTGGHRDVRRLGDAALERYGPLRAAGLAALVVFAPMLITWRAMVVGLSAGLTGRAWVMHSYVAFGAEAVLVGMLEWTTWGTDPARRDRLLDALPWVAGGLVVLKLLVAGGALAVLFRRGEFDYGTGVKILLAWLLAVAVCFGVLAWLVPVELAARHHLALGAVLAVPLVRPLAAPLALGWNRHR